MNCGLDRNEETYCSLTCTDAVGQGPQREPDPIGRKCTLMPKTALSGGCTQARARQYHCGLMLRSGDGSFAGYGLSSTIRHPG